MSLPPLHYLDDYWGCVEKGNDFCTALGALSSSSPDNPLWQQILANATYDLLLDKSLLHRGICVPKEYSGNLNLQKQYAETYLNEEINNLNLTSNIIQFACLQGPKFRTYDYLITLVVVLYFSLVIAVSVYDKWIVKGRNSASAIWNLSIFHNWNAVVHEKNGRDYERLKCMQGMRFIQMVINIFGHTLLSYLFVFIDDASNMERKLEHPIVRPILMFVPLVIQTFFLISSWLCMLQIYNIYEANGKFTLSDLLVLIVNRYFRLIPCLLFACIILTTEWLQLLGSSPNLYYLCNSIKAACENNMLPTLLFCNNFYFVKDMCNPVTWYTSVDFQLYVLSAVIVYLILKFRWNYIKVVIIGTVLACLLYGSIIYARDLDAAFRLRLRHMELVRFLESVPFKESYTATYTSLTTPFVGIMFGFIYVRTRHRNDLHKNKTLVALWYILFFGLFWMSILLSQLQYGPVTKAIVGPLLKPLYTFSIGVGILGLSHNIGGITKKILESRFFEIMGNFCYGTYITHVFFSFTRGVNTYTLYEINRWETDMVFAWVGSFLSGTFLSLALEQPASVLQKKLLPQLKKKSKVANESEKSMQKGVSANGKHKHK